MISKIFKSSFGWAGVAVSEQGVAGIALPGGDRRAVEQELAKTVAGARKPEKSKPGPESGDHPAKRTKAEADADKLVQLLQRYFRGEPVVFDLQLDLRYYTPFQRAVWRAASKIPYGETSSYGRIAKAIGNPRAARAVGQAMGANPVPILVP